MDKGKFVKEWLNIAEMDIASAKYLMSMQPVPIEIICYHCQQSAEKFIKGFLAYNEAEIIKTHDLVALNNACCIYDEEFKLIQDGAYV